MENNPVLNAHNKAEFPPAHSAEHILNQTMVRMFGCSRSKINHIERKKSKCDYELSICPTEHQIRTIEAKVNEIISQDLPISTKFVTRDEIPSYVDTSKLPIEAKEIFRIVYIGDYDVCLCLGSHVKSTSEIGTFRISSTNYDNGKFRIVFRIDTINK